MSFEERFDDESKKFRKSKSQIINKRNQKINLVKKIKEVIADLMKSEIEQIKKILLRMIEVLKIDLKEDIESFSKLVRTLNRIENKFQTIEKQNANQSIKVKTYANVIKAATKITRIKNENENTMKKMITANMTATKKEKKMTMKIENEVEKKKLQNVTNIEFLKRIKRAIENSKSETMKLKWLFSENLMLFLASSMIKKELKNNTQWIKAIENSVKILKKSYEIMMHEIRVQNVDAKKQNKTIEKLLKQNEMFHKNLNIIRMTWSKSVEKMKKTYSSLIIETGFSEKINRIIIRVAVWNGMEWSRILLHFMLHNQGME